MTEHRAAIIAWLKEGMERDSEKPETIAAICGLATELLETSDRFASIDKSLASIAASLELLSGNHGR